MWRGIALFVALSGLAGSSVSLAATSPVVGEDLWCEDSLASAEAVLETLYAELESTLSTLERARLRRAHTDWLRFRGSDCAFAAAGEPAPKCCLLSQTQERTDALGLYQAQLGAVEFRTWRDPIRTPEKEDLRQRVSSRGPSYSVPVLPDQILRIGDAQYLLAFSSTLSDARGLEYLNLRQKAEIKVLEGGPNLLRVLPDKGDVRHAVVMSDTTDSRTLWRELYLVWLGENTGRLAVHKQRLALFREDAGSGRCDSHSVKFLKMDKAVVPGEVRFADSNKDGFADIVVTEVEIDCRTQEETERKLTFLAGDAGFGEAIRSNP